MPARFSFRVRRLLLGTFTACAFGASAAAIWGLGHAADLAPLVAILS